MLTILAQTNGDAVWISGISLLANVGFSGLVAWYLLTRALPDMIKSFRDEMASVREDYEERQKAYRSDHKDALQVVMAHCESESKRRDDTFKAEMQMINMAVRDEREILEEVRDALREMRTKPT